jgi:hypothetical protein
MTIRIQRGIQDAPDGVPAQAQRQDDQQQLSERLRQHDPKRAARVGDPPAAVGRGHDRQEPDDGVDQRFRGEAKPCQTLNHRVHQELIRIPGNRVRPVADLLRISQGTRHNDLPRGVHFE